MCGSICRQGAANELVASQMQKWVPLLIYVSELQELQMIGLLILLVS